jgi:fructose-1,6-bisphosphatase/inositol monophosphatase family enzyme
MQQYLETAIDIANTAREIMLRYFGTGVTPEWKQDHSPVTVADREINQMVIDRISARYPNHGVVAEEGSQDFPDAVMRWVCDPIDGTVPFMLGVPTSVFALALCEDGDPIVSVVVDPYVDRLYTAVKGEGSFCNDQRLQVSGATDLSHTTGNVSGRSADDPARGAEIHADLIDAGVRLFHHHAMVYEAALVAAGKFDSAIYAKAHPWDAAAGALLVTEAGGKVSDLKGRPQRYDRTVAGTVFSNGLLHDELVAITAPHVVVD